MSKDSKLPKENVKPPRLKQEESDSDDESVSSLVSLNSSAASSTSSNRDVCPICLGSFRKQVSARPDVCEHKFCLECLEEWSKKTNTCPIDRKTFQSIRVNDESNRLIKVESRQSQEDQNEDVTNCEVCGRSDREDRMLLCDGCDRGYHCECLSPRLNEIPEGTWFCPDCNTRQQQRRTRPTTTPRLRETMTFVRPFVRTRFSERIRHTVNVSRIQRGAYIIISESESDEDDSDESEDDDDDDDEDYLSENELNDLERDTNSIDDSITSAIQRALNTTLSTITSKRLTRTTRPTRKRKRRVKRTSRKKAASKSSSSYSKPAKRRRKTTRRRRRRFRRVASKNSASVQEKILNSIYKAQLRRLNEVNEIKETISLNAIQREVEANSDKYKYKSFPKPSQTWYQDNYLNEISESDPNIPLSSMSLIRNTSRQSLNTNQASLDILDSILSSQKVLLAPSSQVQVNRDGTLDLRDSKHKKSDITKTNSQNLLRSNSSKRKMEDSNVLLTHVPYDPFNPDDDDDDDKPTASNESSKQQQQESEITNEDFKKSMSREKTTTTTTVKKESSKSPRAKKTADYRSHRETVQKGSNDQQQIKREHSRSRSSSRSRSDRHSVSRSNNEHKSHNHYHHHYYINHHSSRSVKCSRSRSPSRHRKYSRSTTTSDTRSSSHLHERSNQLNLDKKKTDKMDTTIQSDSASNKKENSLKSQFKSSPKYADSLFVEMISQERQQTIDINSIKLPLNDNNKPTSTASDASNVKKEPEEHETQSLDKRLNELFNTSVISGEKDAFNSNVKMESELNENSTNGTKQSELNNSTQRTVVKKEPQFAVKDETYDLEHEYQTKVSISNIKQVKESSLVKPILNNQESKSYLDTQEKIVNVAKGAIKPFYVSKIINKNEYKLIMKKVVTKSLEHNKKGSIIDSDKVKKMVTEYAKKMSMEHKQHQQKQQSSATTGLPTSSQSFT